VRRVGRIGDSGCGMCWTEDDRPRGGGQAPARVTCPAPGLGRLSGSELGHHFKLYLGLKSQLSSTFSANC